MAQTVQSRPPGKHRRHRRHCPQCGKQSAARSNRKTLGEYAISIIGIRPYRCHDCGHRFMGRRWRIEVAGSLQCPKCTYTGVQRVSKDRIRRSWRNHLWRILQFPAYRCPECRTKFYSIKPYRPRSDDKPESETTISD